MRINWRNVIIIIGCILTVGFIPVHGKQVYKYKDEEGNWQFSDRMPTQQSKPDLKKQQLQKIELSKPKKRKPMPHVFHSMKGQKYVLLANNPLHAPIQIEVMSSVGNTEIPAVTVKPLSKKVLKIQDDKVDAGSYRWTVGDPAAKADNYVYHFPVRAKARYKITQAFNGKFSHSKEPNKYAVDIAMPVGTNITTARDGVVILVKNDFHMSGRSGYFLDKANYVAVLHKDGTYATYAHTLSDSVTVKLGQFVRAGDVLARSGSSGFSTGPHLHFTIKKNSGNSTVSIPFKFKTRHRSAFIPERGQEILVN